MIQPQWILYSDNHLLAISKPAGMLTQDSGSGEENLEDMARQWVAKERNKPGNVFLHAVHRIDRDVSGVVLFACTSKALSRLNSQMQQRRGEKKYWAIVEGILPERQGNFVHWLIHGDHRAEKTKAGESGAKECHLTYTVRSSRSGLTLVEIALITGYYHQIRAQFAAQGHPIAGDKKYQAKMPLPPHHIALHHRKLTVVHPTHRTPISFRAPIPSWWYSAFPKTILAPLKITNTT